MGLFLASWGSVRALKAVERPAAERIETRSFPSVFQAWNGIGGGDASQDEGVRAIARHDLLFQDPGFYFLRWEGGHPGLATGFTTASSLAANAFRKRLLLANPHLVLLAEIRYRDAPSDHLPADHAWWKRENGERAPGWEEGGYFLLDYANHEFRMHVARQAAAAIKSGVVDGIMFDWWSDDDDHLALLREIRAAIGEEPLVLVNSNDRQIPRCAPLVNGLFMECVKSHAPEDWQRIAATLAWAEQHLRQPRINCLETWFEKSRNDLALMRMTTTLSLVLSDGYCLFSDPNPLATPDHLHDWYPFWDAPLGRPRGRTDRRADGSIHRAFTGGSAVYNPPGNRIVTVTFDTVRRSAASGKASHAFRLYGGDGDLYLNPASRDLPPD